MALLDAIEPDDDSRARLGPVLKRRARYLESRAHHVMERSAVGPGIDTNHSWRQKMTAATLFQEAAETAAAVGEFSDARAYLSEAANLLLQLNLPFGALLQRTFSLEHDETNIAALATHVQNSWENSLRHALELNNENPDLFADIQPDADLHALPVACQSQQQWAYVLLSAAISIQEAHFNEHERQQWQRLSHVLTKQAPVGRMRMPMKNYLLVSAFLKEANMIWEENDADLIKVIGESLTSLYRAVQSARENTYLWNRMLAPMPLFDLDTAILVRAVIKGTNNENMKATDLVEHLKPAIPAGSQNYVMKFLEAVKRLRIA